MLCQGEALRPYIERGLGVDMPKEVSFIGQVDTAGVPVSIAAFSWWCGFDCEVSLWSTGSLSRDFLARIGSYVFDELGCTRATCRVAADNPWHTRLPRLGFVLEGRMRGGFDGITDALIFGVRKEEYRYGPNWRKRQREGTKTPHGGGTGAPD